MYSQSLYLQNIVPICTVNLSADALPIPGGYVAPERGSITFTCSSSSGKTLFWNLRVAESGDPKQYSRIDVGTTALHRLPGFSIPDESSTTNPASFTFHNISLENNPSPVQCNDLAIQENSTAMIIVEGEVSIQCHINLNNTWDLFTQKLFNRENQAVHHIHSSFYSYATNTYVGFER